MPKSVLELLNYLKLSKYVFNTHIRKSYRIINYVIRDPRHFKLTSSILLCLKTIIMRPDKSLCIDTEKNLDIIIEMAEKALKDGQIQDAETTYLIALKVAELNHLDEIVSQIYDSLINISYTIGDYQNARILVERLLDRLISSGKAKDDNTVITFKMKLARLYAQMGNYDMADRLFSDCILLQKKKIGSESITESTGVLYVDLLFWYGIFLYQNQQFKNALTNMKTAYNFSNEINGINPSQKLVILTIMAEIQCASGDLNGAIINIEKAIAVGEHINHQELSLLYILLGNIYLKLQMFNEAMKWCEEGERLSSKQNNSKMEQASKSCLDQIRQEFETKYEKNQEHA